MKHGATLAEGLLDADDCKEILAQARELEVKKLVAQKMHEHAMKDAKPRLLRIPDQSDFTVSEASDFLPKVLGCRIVKDSDWHQCWQVFYPCAQAPFSCTRVWNAKRNSKTALRLVIEWAWESHGSICPYDLSSLQ